MIRGGEVGVGLLARVLWVFSLYFLLGWSAVILSALI